MKRYFEKNETLCTILLIILYVVTNSYCMKNFGYTSYISTIINTIISILVISIMIILKRVKYYGITKVNNIKKCLYFIPLLLIVSVNLLNGADLIPTLLQICYAISLGYLFVTILIKSKSLIPCIITHILINFLSIFNVDNTNMMYITSIFLVVISIIYSFYLNKFIKD